MIRCGEKCREWCPSIAGLFLPLAFHALHLLRQFSHNILSPQCGYTWSSSGSWRFGVRVVPVGRRAQTARLLGDVVKQLDDGGARRLRQVDGRGWVASRSPRQPQRQLLRFLHGALQVLLVLERRSVVAAAYLRPATDYITWAFQVLTPEGFRGLTAAKDSVKNVDKRLRKV